MIIIVCNAQQVQNYIRFPKTSIMIVHQIQQSNQTCRRKMNDNNEGLPNIGLTCFLNSVLQMLYAAAEFREIIIQNKEEHGFINALALIFEDIRNGRSNNLKRAHLEQFVKKLSKLNENFEKNTMQDALQFLLLILNRLEEIDGKYVQKFQVEYNMTCLCNYSNLNFHELAMNANQIICISCKNKTQVTIWKSSKYLICLSSANKQGKFQRVKFFNNKTLKYKICSRILYEGNGVQGHYIAERKANNEKFYHLNDNHIEEMRKWGKPLINLYQKLEKTQVLESPIVEIEQKAQNIEYSTEQIEMRMITLDCGDKIPESILKRKINNLLKSQNQELKCTNINCNRLFSLERVKQLISFNPQEIKQTKQQKIKAKIAQYYPDPPQQQQQKETKLSITMNIQDYFFGKGNFSTFFRTKTDPSWQNLYSKQSFPFKGRHFVEFEIIDLEHEYEIGPALQPSESDCKQINKIRFNSMKGFNIGSGWFKSTYFKNGSKIKMFVDHQSYEISFTINQQETFMASLPQRIAKKPLFLIFRAKDTNTKIKIVNEQ